ncbi:hypothetical protein VTK26DRAFT_7832 [Humicola hyalothermophila]
MATDFGQLTVMELRQELKQRNLPQTGKKADLVERLAAYEREHTASGAGDANDDNHEARDSPNGQSVAEQRDDTKPKSPTPEPSPNVENASQTPAGNRDSTDASKADQPSEPPQDFLPVQNSVAENKIDEVVASEPVTTTEIVKDAVSRKRRSRSPPPSETELSRKRARPDEQPIEEDSARPVDTEPQPIDTAIDRDTAQRPPTDDHMAVEEPSRHDHEADKTDPAGHDRHRYREASPRHQDQRYDVTSEHPADDDREIEPALHPATPALYIKNFMRPLREPVLRDFLIDLAALPGAAPDPDCLVNFYLDQIRTHAFVRFTTVSAASRVRAALHGTVWPNERNRKELWVDFIPEDKVVEWVGREQSEGGRGSSSRWEVHYEPDDNGEVIATLVNAEAEPARRNTATRQPLGPPPVPTGPARNTYPGVEGAPLGPRGRGGNHYRQPPPPPPQSQMYSSASGDRDFRVTRAGPPVRYRPVPEELAARRLANLRSYITKDRHRDLGRPDEINRYTFEHSDEFVDRGKEAFIGIRPPHRERERRRLGIGRGQPRRPPSPRRGHHGGRDDYGRGRRDDHDYDYDYDRRDDRDFGRRDNVPRSRFDGQPLPTYTGPGPRGPRRGGGRRDRY